MGHGCWISNLGPLQEREQYVLLTVVPALKLTPTAPTPFFSRVYLAVCSMAFSPPPTPTSPSAPPKPLEEVDAHSIKSSVISASLPQGRGSLCSPGSSVCKLSWPQTQRPSASAF